MKQLINFLIGFVAGFTLVLKILSKKKKDERIINEPPEINPFPSEGRLIEVLKKFNEIKQKI